MTSTITNNHPNYDLNTIFRPYFNEVVGESVPGTGNTSDVKNPLNYSSDVVTAEEISLYNIEISRLPLLDSEEPLMSWLLRAAGMIPDSIMRDSIELSRSGNVPLSELLKLSGRVTHSDLRSLERAIFYVSNGSIYRGFAAIALSYSCSHFVDFEEALWDLGLHPNDPFCDAKIVCLIESCGLLPKDKLLSVRKECLANGLTVGWALVKNELMSAQFVKVLLECLSAVGSRKLDYDTLVLTVISVMPDTDVTIYGAERTLSPEALLVSQLQISTADRALANLLLGSSIMEIEDLIFCAEVALEDKRSMGVVISDLMIVDPILLQAARTLAYMLCEKKLTARRSVELMEEVKRTGRPLSQLFLEGNRGDLTVVPSNKGISAVSSIA